MTSNRPQRRRPTWWRWAAQVLVLVLLLLVVLWLGTNLIQNLQRLRLPFSFGFLNTQAGFDIGETPIAYSPTDTYLQALGVGLVNSLRVMGTGIVLATIVGIAIGIARLSTNWLLRQLALVYVETLRNLPLLLQLLFWYLAVFFQLPPFAQRVQWPGPIYLSKQGIVLPGLELTTATPTWLSIMGGASTIALVLWRRQVHRQLNQGHSTLPWLGPLLILIGGAAIAGLLTQAGPFGWDLPQVVNNLQVQGGLQLSAEFSALLLGLTLYTAAFIAEIVRAGITSVAQGQREAARALGLKPGMTMRLVIFPQALRVIVPPLTSQYLNLAKNSSLAIAIGYPDLYAVSSTTFNQTGRAVEIFLLLMVTYLVISLTLSLLMNSYNRSLQIVER